MKIIAIDHGEKHIGLAITDPTGTLPRSLRVIQHVSRLVDAAQIATIASENEANLIVIGQSFDEEGRPNLAGRRAARFAEALGTQTSTPIVLWDESFSTQEARQSRLELGGRRRDRTGHMDDLAAVFILRSYLEAHPDQS